MARKPGPWVAYSKRVSEPFGDKVAVSSFVDGPDAAVQCFLPHQPASVPDSAYPIAQDARLMAAAPELLSALKGLLVLVDITQGEMPAAVVELRNAARMAIAKAEGLQS